MKKQYFLVVDVETANMCEDALVYDLGFAVCDRMGNIYETRSYVIRDIFFDEKEIFGNETLMASAYYAEKLPIYYEGMREKEWEVNPLLIARREIRDLIYKYEISKVWAYNCNFDRNALNTTVRYITKSNVRWFFPYGVEFHCIWNFACETILQQKRFFKMAEKENWFSEKGNLRTSAEIAYRYMHKVADFEEKHTGLQDVLIEVEILAKCYAQHKKADTTINRMCWRKPTKAYREWLAD